MVPSIQYAREFALMAHGNQRYGERPYSYHLDAVATLLEPFGETAQIAGYLHDVVEDSDVTVAEIRDVFGDEIADCVALVTDEVAATRRERKAKTNEKLAASTNSLALVVKAADRLANLLESSRDPVGGKLDMYRQEHEAFKKAAFRPGVCDDLWTRINGIIG